MSQAGAGAVEIFCANSVLSFGCRHQGNIHAAARAVPVLVIIEPRRLQGALFEKMTLERVANALETEVFVSPGSVPRSKKEVF